ncbi:MAG: bifunctional salicylyl-CoA 5-hydroxylase/oxidoreductase [Actinobacteria bacterium]|nr:bifunctional salicylyl-CoA 5-hydroxylase/oxidoreductase [Actinomycetota bacterium]
MRIAVLGGGPGGLYFAALARQLDPRHEITVWERNAPGDTFGFGVVLSDETLGGIEHADPRVFRAMEREFARWDDIDVHYRGTVTTSGGHGFAAMSRHRLLEILQERCAELGVAVRYRTEAPPAAELAAGHDLVVAADGANSGTRTALAGAFRPSRETRRCKYIWLGTDLVFDAFKFYVLDTPWGVMQVHGYPYRRDASTFILEARDDVWERAGFGAAARKGGPLPPGRSDEESIAMIGELCADVLGGHSLTGNNSQWISFTTIRCQAWRHRNIALLGDAAHTAHFSIGSGTKLAMEDALALAACLREQPGVPAALAAYEAERQPVVASTQRAAQASLEWFENIGQYTGQDPAQFAFNIITRSRRVTYDNLRLRDPEFVARMDDWFAGGQDPPPGGGVTSLRNGQVPGSSPAETAGRCPPMFQPGRIGRLWLPNRVIVSPMDMYSARDGVPGDFHLVHLGSKALGGAGLVMTEMVCVSEAGRISPGCAGLYTPEQEAAWRRIVTFVHEHAGARIGAQLGHSGRKGSTRLMWEGMDEPLPEGNWEVCGPSPLPYSPASQVPRELTAGELAAITGQFAAAAAAAGRAGFDLLELHCAHGYLLSSFLSPLANQRTDRYGGSLAGRLRYPLEVFDAVRAAWPAGRPLTVRISATDWHDGGVDSDEAVEIARAFAEHGADGIDVSTGQVVSDERPAFGRSYQTPYADRIRNEIGTKYGAAVIAVGAISSWDDVNSIILAGRADFCALGRAHLYDPQWTLHAAAEQGYQGPAARWPDQFAAGSRRPQAGRTDGPRPRLELIRSGPPATAHRRWRPAGNGSPRP